MFVVIGNWRYSDNGKDANKGDERMARKKIQTSLSWYTDESPELTELYKKPGTFKANLLAAIRQYRTENHDMLLEILREVRELRTGGLEIQQKPSVASSPLTQNLAEKLTRMKNL